MPKKKNKNKMSGSVKTQLKTEKKLNARHKKELAARGEDDIEKIVAKIEQEEARRQRVTEAVVGPPSRRVNFTLTPHPFKDELIMFGGEFYDGRQTTVYGDLFFYNINKKEWRVVRAPGAPPPRCGHQAIATSRKDGELWVFGGEFSSPSESQFYHYKDLWVFHLKEKKWEKITAPGGPSARSGHRIVHVPSFSWLVVFGGFQDYLTGYKYFNDIHVFAIYNYTWHKVETQGIPPAPRSGCVLFPLPLSPQNFLVYGGYSKEKIKKNVDKGHVHQDMFYLKHVFNPSSQIGIYKWVYIHQNGIHVTPRCGISGALIQPNQAMIFGGVYDDEQDDDDENLKSTFYNNLISLDLEKFQWRFVIISGKKLETTTRRRRKQKDEKNEGNEDEQKSDSEDEKISEESPAQPAAVTSDDGIFTVTVGPAIEKASCAEASSSNRECSENTVFSPSPRMNAGMAVKNNILYLYGGMIEDGNCQYTLSDFYSLDCRKLDEWKTLLTDDLTSQEWYGSSSESEESDSEEEEEEEEEEEDDDESNNDNDDESVNINNAS